MFFNLFFKYLDKELIPRFCQVDPLFKLLYKDLYYTGSYYKGLKVGKPDEFDLNIVLYNEALMHYVKVERSQPGYVQLRVGMKGFRQDEDRMTGVALAQFEGLLNGSGKGLRQLNPKAVNQWFFNVVKKAYGLIPKKVELDSDAAQFRKIKHFDIKQNGPALTLMLELTNGHKVDLDLVPVLPFKRRRLRKFGIIFTNVNQPNWLRKPTGLPKAYRMNLTDGFNQNFFAIPKPGPSELDWPIHFPYAEKEIIFDLGCVKPVIRVLKLFRDSNPVLSEVKSYALVTIVMKMIREDFQFWIQNRPSICFLSALENLEKAINSGHLGWFFDERCNKLPQKDFPPNKCKEIAQFLHAAILKMKQNETNWHEYFE